MNDQNVNKPRIAITMGDAAGIGPEILVKALACEDLKAGFRFLILGEKRALEHARNRWCPHLPITVISSDETWDCQESTPVLMDLGADLPREIPLGAINPDAGRLAARCIEKAARLAVAGQVDAMVTCPIHKEALALAGIDFPGHTEFLAHLTGAKKVVMMLAGDTLKVTLVTIHCPLSEVAGMLTREKVEETIMLTHEGLKHDFGLPRPRLAVAGFNPHAGEGGLFGKEESQIIAPAVETTRRSGVEAIGPLPPDTIFYKAVKGEFDAVVCMYHDQGLIPLKLAHFSDAVNVTLGLPIVRVSVDHGTAYDIVGKGIADPTSLINAVKTAEKIVYHRTARGKN